jgi:MFS transporter, NNP family, nitrate/nitrite transporter
VLKYIILPLFWSLWYLAFTSRTIISPYLPLIEKEFSINHAMAGGLYLFIAAGTTVALSAAGFVAGRIGYKRLIALSFLTSVGALIALYYANTYLMFAISLFFFGLCGGSYLPCAVPILTSFFQPKHWGKVISFHETAASFNILTIPVIAAFAMGFMPWRNVLVVLGGLFALLTIVFWILAPDPRPQRASSVGFAQIIKRTDFWIMTAFWAINSISAMGVYSIVPLFLVDEKNMALETANRILGYTRVGGIVGVILIGFFLDRLNTKKILFFLTLASGLSTIALAAMQTEWLLIAMLLLQATFSVVFFAVGLMAISKLSEPDERSVYTGTIMAFSVVASYGFAPIFLGAVADVWNFQAGMYVIGLLTLMVCPLVRFFHKI